MSQAMVLDILRDMLTTLMLTAGPILIIALGVGLIVSIIQATTQVQEQTLTFVPKLAAVLISLMILGTFMINTLISFTHRIFSNISTIIK